MLLVKGNVQGVGYRVVVRQVAQRRGIKGKVKNLDDGSVEIYCQGDNEYSVLNFIDAIKLKQNNSEDIHAIIVDEIEEVWEGEEGFEKEDGYKPIEEMRRFEIDYDNGAMTPFEKINLRRLETGSLMMYGVNQGLLTTHSDFVKLDVKYDKVSEKLQSIDNNISELAKHIGTIVEEFVKNRKNIND